MNVAFVYDRVNKWGGAERVLMALHELWPEAPLYTAVYDCDRAPWASVFDVRVSFLNNLPFARSHHEFYPWLTPFAFETFNFDEYDVVISVTSAEAKGIITKPQALHICYCLTPTRYLWSGFDQYVENPGTGYLDILSGSLLNFFGPGLKKWDKIASSRPDYYVAISDHVSDRIKRYYGRRVERVIYPPAMTNNLLVVNSKLSTKNYFLVVSRLVGYKRVDLVIDAFNALGWPLIIIGTGLARKSLEVKAEKNIQFVTHYLTDRELAVYYENCRALICPQDEDFGLVAVEAQAAGKPVISFNKSGVAEIIKDPETGLLFNKQTKESLIHALQRSVHITFDRSRCQKNAERFTTYRFQQEMKATVHSLYQRRHLL